MPAKDQLRTPAPLAGLPSGREKMEVEVIERSEGRETALVTGASGGIGLELAEVFAERGFDLIAVARREDRLRALAERCEKEHGTRVEVIPADLLDPKAAKWLFDAVEDRGLQVDVLVNNAGVTASGAFRENELETYLRLISLNVSALTALTHLFVGPMVERGGGRILNVASTAAFQPVPTLAVYAATKAFVLSLSEALSEELKGTGVTVTTLCPGLTKTDMVDNVQASNETLGAMPDFLIADARGVAEEGFDACKAGRVIAVPGVTNWLGATAVRLYPRWLVRTVGGLVARRIM